MLCLHSSGLGMARITGKMSISKRETSLLVGVLIVLLLVFPFNLTVAPDWRVKVIDEKGKPLAGAYVSEFGAQGDGDPRPAAACTGLTGEAHFSRRTIRASILTRISKWRFNIHGARSPYLAVGVDRLGYGDMPPQVPAPNFNGITWYGSSSRMNSEITLQKCPEGWTGFKCSIRYHDFFAINSSAQQIAACVSSPRTVSSDKAMESGVDQPTTAH